MTVCLHFGFNKNANFMIWLVMQLQHHCTERRTGKQWKYGQIRAKHRVECIVIGDKVP